MVTNLLISPTEPDPIVALGQRNSLPERYGVDIMWLTRQGHRWGIQRKEVTDFLASRSDGRLAKELGQMEQLDRAVFVIEGRTRWTGDGVMANVQYQEVRQHHWHAMQWSLRMRGHWVETTDSIQHTCDVARWLASWSQKDRHSGMRGRPKPSGTWGHVTDEEWGVHVLTSFDGVGIETARRIYDHFGTVPIKWEVSYEDLLLVDGIGPKKATALVEALGRKVSN